MPTACPVQSLTCSSYFEVPVALKPRDLIRLELRNGANLHYSSICGGIAKGLGEVPAHFSNF